MSVCSIVRVLLTVGVVMVVIVQQVEGGECCKAHYDVMKNELSNDQKWCDNYCCFYLLKYDCCDNVLLRAPEDMRLDFCWAWVTAHIHVPIIVALVILGLIISCCVCCCCVHGRNHKGTVLQPAPPSGFVFLSNNTPTPNDQGSSRGNPLNVGYDQ